MKTAPIAVDLPPSYLVEIGRIITWWAYIEWQLQAIVCLLLSISIKQGRLAAKIPRTQECPSLIKQLADIREIDIPEPLLADLSTDLRKASEQRDRLAHSIWFRSPKTDRLFVQVTRGTSESGKSRKILPEGVSMSVPELNKLANLISEVAARVEQLHHFLDGVRSTSPKKFAPPSPVRRTPKVSNRKAHHTPQKS